MTGTGEARIFSMIARVESSSPPGVCSSISTASALVWRACSMARSMYSALMGWMVSSTRILTTLLAKALLDASSGRTRTHKSDSNARHVASFRRVNLGEHSGARHSTAAKAC